MVNHPNRGKKERAVLVTTSHRGVFFGYAIDTDGNTINLRAARNCLYWPQDGYGDGSGDGYGSYWAAVVPGFAAKWPTAQRERLIALQSAGAKIAYWRSDENGRPANGGNCHNSASPGMVQKIEGPLVLCSEAALHATLIPPKWKGERWWIVALIGEVQGDDEKYGALEREIIGECL